MEHLRYSKQIILDGFGLEGQKKLTNAKILVIGAGGLGSPALFYLAAAGVGTIGIADFDTVTLSNFNRQIIHFDQDIGTQKTASAADKIKAFNPSTILECHNERLQVENIADVICKYDVIIDATDTFTSRYLISDCCYFLKKPLIEGAATGYWGTLMTIVPDVTPCYRCLYPNPPEDGTIASCSETGILGAVTGVIGSLQALEAVKLIVGIGETTSQRFLYFNSLSTSFDDLELRKDLNCELCGRTPSIKELVEYEIKCNKKGVLD